MHFPIFVALSISFACASQVQQPNVPYVVPPKFCQSLPGGKYCDPSFPRSYIDCPSGTGQFCGANEICTSDNATSGQVKCVPNLWNPFTQICLNKPEGTSYCFGNMTVNCPNGDVFQCPTDLACERRGRRAYCIQPKYLNNEPEGGFCEGVANNRAVCHPVNLKKIINCPGGAVEFCGGNTMCDVPAGMDEACCVPFESNVERWCSNKPLLSSFCLAEGGDKMVLCTQTPQILNCPEGTSRCFQQGSIRATCL